MHVGCLKYTLMFDLDVSTSLNRYHYAPDIQARGVQVRME